jgi:hypothetical protein
MKLRFTFLISGMVLAAMQLALAQTGALSLPRSVEAGSAFSIQSTGSGKATLYIIGLGQVLRRDVQLGETTSFAPGDLHNAGHYLAVLVGESATDHSSADHSPTDQSSTYNGAFDVTAADQPAALSFLAKPSRLPVGLHGGISGVVYVFDTFQNLVLTPVQVSFQLSEAAGGQRQTVTTRDGVAWTKMDSGAKEVAAQFVAQAGSVSATRVIQQVPGNPCSLRMSAHRSGQRLVLETEPVRDCGGNAVPDGTIVTFTEASSEGQATVDVPIKRGIARTEMPAYNAARVSVATGVVMGNEIRLGKE